ncbi:MAG: KpsF/GutQ family sugar-phosphate isomerase [Gammaproteobacteria bacterium]
MPGKPDKQEYLDIARRVIENEAAAIGDLAPRLGDEFADACRICMDCVGRVVVTGMGKSGHVGGKIAATLASTGTPSFFVHPGEASHGDVGMITQKDAVIAISNSGETAEIITILPLLKRLAMPLITMTGTPASTLGEAADVVLNTGVREEACPLNLAPTSSTSATMAMGDALAVALLETRGFTAEDFALSHPGGSLGRRLLLRVEDIMFRGDDVPRVTADTLLADGLLEMTRKGLGMTAIVDGHDRLRGVFTDGDLRRALDRNVDVHTTTMKEVMTGQGQTVRPEQLAAETVRIMQDKRINGLLVVDADDRLVGALNIHNLFRVGVM